MSALEKLKAACAKKSQPAKPYKSFSALPPGEYAVYEFSKIETKHGQRIRITLRDSYMYLPERCILDDADIKELNSVPPRMMVYGGKEASEKNRLILDFY